ncbi:cupin domain-containing protein [Leptolyngbya sp. FACHB-261]|uniref:cupin domain-containing protein n=1 Tax=Leptolyngbya sp. FACHB-261 TaxID=2692806 RepID=UPI00168756D0|nr:cupin domain-containing protein [Leptolyngbya sp. FACHB-261]MBD2101031.1 cupin domain-containing protein [Leptolyngbya sp. FACHB-261]
MTLPIILQPGEGRSVKIQTSTCTFKATGEDTQGHFGLFEFVMEPGAIGARPHIHKQLTEMFYVVEGEVDLMLGQDQVTASPGAFMIVPENTPHGFSNRGSQPATLLIMFCPADHREQYFEGLADLTREGRQPSREELFDLMQRFDQYPVPEQASNE